MKKILYISAILLFVFAVFGKAQAKDGESGRDDFRIRASTSGSFGENQWSRGGDDDEDESDDDDSRTRIRTSASISSTVTDDDNDSTDDSDDGEENESDDDKGGLREEKKDGFKLFPSWGGIKREGALDMIRRQETATTTGTHSPFFKENKGESDNRNSRADFRNKIGMRFTFAMKNLNNLRTRLSAHIDSLATKGIVTTTASALLGTADTDIASAKIAVDALQAKIESVLVVVPPTPPTTATTTGDAPIVQPTLDDSSIAEIRALATSAKDAIVKAYRSLGLVIMEIKKLHQENDVDDEDDSDDDDDSASSSTSSTATTTN